MSRLRTWRLRRRASDARLLTWADELHDWNESERIAKRIIAAVHAEINQNLAADIKQNLRTLCSAETMAKVEVSNLDAWVGSFIRSRKLEHRIVYDRKQDAARQAWESALATKDSLLELPDDFYEQELEQVVLAQGG